MPTQFIYLIIYNSLIDVSDACSHRATSFIPGELELIKDKIKLQGVEESINTGGDITKSNVQSSIIRLQIVIVHF